MVDCFIGIDVAAAHLDFALHPQGEYFRVSNDAKGLAEAKRKLAAVAVAAVVMEATGGLEKLSARELRKAGMVVHVVNPRRIASWRQVVAKQAKTDLIDAKLIAAFAAAIPLTQAHISTPRQEALRDLAARREQVVRESSNLKKQRLRVNTHAVQNSMARHLAFLQEEIQHIESHMQKLFAEDEALAHQCTLLSSIPGIGTLSAMLILADLPEITFLPPKKLAALVGVAPHPDHSGKKTNRAHIRGGRTRIRTKCYIMAHNAIRYNPWLQEYANRLKERGKSRREIVIACINKLLHAAHAVLTRNQPWQPNPPKNLLATS